MTKKDYKVTFAGFRIREIAAKDYRESGGKREKNGVMEIAPEIGFGFAETNTEAPFHLIAIIKLNATLKRVRAQATSAPSTEVFIEAEASFDVTNATLKEFRQLLTDHAFLDRIADQVYPLVSSRLSRLLGEMGISADPTLSLPEVERRETVNQVPLLEEAGQAKSKAKSKVTKK